MSLPSRTSPLDPGSLLGDFQIIAPLKSGGMATLFLGRKIGPAGFARPVAIKVVHPHLAVDQSFVDMFLDEARLSANIRHPNVVHVEALGETEGIYYLVMEYVHGCTLQQFLQKLGRQGRKLSPEIAAYIAMKVADGLHAAHEAKNDRGEPLGVVHRDVSPQNVLLGYDGQVKLIDFGVAKAKGQSNETSGGSLRGKLRYMSPEQAWGHEVDRRADVYALGIVLWESLAFRRLFDGENDFLILQAVRNPTPQRPSELAQGISEGLDHAVMTALAVNQEGRFQTAQAMRRAIGGGCPGALQVEPDDLAALLGVVMDEDIQKTHMTLPQEVSSMLRVPKMDASEPLEEFTSVSAVPASFISDDDPADPRRHDPSSSRIVPSGQSPAGFATGMSAAPQGRSWAWAVAVTLGIAVGGIAIAIAVRPFGTTTQELAGFPSGKELAGFPSGKEVHAPVGAAPSDDLARGVSPPEPRAEDAVVAPANVAATGVATAATDVATETGASHRTRIARPTREPRDHRENMVAPAAEPTMQASGPIIDSLEF